MKYALLKNKITGVRSIYNSDTKEKIVESNNPSEYLRLRKLALNNLHKSQRNECMKDLGLVSYRTESGAICWE